MKYIHFEASGILAGLATMLEYCNHNTEDYRIAFGMEVPFLFLKDGERFVAGQGLYLPRWMNLYLLPHGFRLTEITLPKNEIPAFLRQHRPAMLHMTIDHGIRHPVVFAFCENNRYRFINVKTEGPREPDSLSLSRQMLLRRLDEKVRVLMLERCPAEPADFVPLLIQSLMTLREYEAAVMAVCQRTVTREELSQLQTPLLRALFTDMLPMAQLLGQPVLHEELRQLHHDYRHIFIHNGPSTAALWERLPRSSIRQCLGWMRENIIDRLYEYGLSDEQVAEIVAQLQHDT